MSKRKNAVLFTKPEEPAFLKRIKEKIGYKEGPNIDTKHEQLPQGSEEDFQDRDDEKPTVVLMDDSRVTESEAQEFIKSLDEEERKGDKDRPKEKDKDDDGAVDKDKEEASGGRIIFRKPEKSRDEESILGNQNVKRGKNDGSLKSKIAKMDDTRKKVKDNRLLSFGDDEEED